MADDDALRVTASVLIPAHELSWTFGPSGGPGGQHANRAHTRAEVRFDVEASSSLSQYQRQRILTRLGAVVIVSADALAAHQSVVNVMDAARRANLPRLTFATQLPADAAAR